MFVFISQRNRLSPFYKSIEDAHDQEKISSQVYRMLSAVNDPFEKILNWVWQKTAMNFVSITYRDLWSLDYTLSHIIHPALIAFKERNTISIPQVDDEDVPNELKYEANGFADFLEADNELLNKRWDYVLDKMIFAHEVIAKDEVFDNHKEVREGLFLFGKYYEQALWI